MSRYFEALLPRRRRSPSDDVVVSLLEAEAAGDIHTGPELLAQCATLLLAGDDTTRNLLGNGLHALLANPPQWEQLRPDPDRLPGAVRELLRYDSPAQHAGQRAADGTVLHGQLVRPNDLVVALIGAANRDPMRYEQPDRLDVTRRQGDSLSLGSGPHVCIGASTDADGGQVRGSEATATWSCVSAGGHRVVRDGAIAGTRCLFAIHESEPESLCRTGAATSRDNW